jgi:sigma-54 specific flagellar transcriptional regulator A
VFPIDVPPLRARVEDVPPLIRRFIDTMEKEERGSFSVADDAMACLMHYRWPGNVRELSNLVERLAILHPEAEVTEAELPEKFREAGAGRGGHPAMAAARRAGAAPEASASDADDILSDMPIGFAERFANDPPVREVPIHDSEGSRADAAPVVLDAGGLDLKAHLADMERSLMVQALEQSDWVVARAAKLLNLQRTTLVEKMRKYDIARPEESPDS